MNVDVSWLQVGQGLVAGRRVRRKLAATIRIHHRRLLLLLSPKADTHFTVSRRVEG